LTKSNKEKKMENVFLTSFSKEELQAIINESLDQKLKSRLEPSKQDEKKEKLLSRNEAAALLKITLVTLSDWSNRGIIQSYYMGGRVYYKEHEIINSLYKTKGGK
jgi:hypothetical protein